MQETFIDLDELILRCRDKASKKLIQEAVSCYRAGAYRSCIVSTWNAVVFDFLHKLRELDLYSSLLDLLKAKSQYKSIKEANTDIIKLFDEYLPKKAEEERETLDLDFLILIITRYRGEIYIDWINDDLKKKSSKASLEDLLDVKQSYYKDIEKQEPKILELLDNFIDQHIKDIPIDDLLGLLAPERFNMLSHKLLDENNYEIIRPILKSHIPLVICKFEKSKSWNSAEFNAILISIIAEYLDPEQWKKVFNAFFKIIKIMVHINAAMNLNCYLRSL
jgi:hypothetical protein